MNPLAHFSGRSGVEREALRAAADWLSRRDAGVAPGDEATFQAWLDADLRHAKAVEEIDAAWAKLWRPRDAGQSEIVLREIAIRRRRRARRRTLGAIVSVFFAAAAAVILMVMPAVQRAERRGPAVASAVAPRSERRVLSDGSVVELKTGAEIAVAFLPDTRAVRLIRGEAIFAVAKNPARPFIVSAQGVEVRAVGTEFAVGLTSGKVAVLVTEGRVRVEKVGLPVVHATVAPLEDAAVFVDAGSRVVVSTTSTSVPVPEQVGASEIAQALAWRGMKLEFTGTPLAAAIQLFNRHNQMQLSLGDTSLGELRITGIFWADDPDGFSRLLEETLNLKVVRPTGDQIVLVR